MSEHEDLKSLEEVLAPFSTDQFLEYWQERACLIRGTADKFRHLFSWRALDAILENSHFEPDNLRLTKNGCDFDANEYLPLHNEVNVRILDVRALTKHLLSGATLVLSPADQYDRQLSSLCASLESVLGVFCYVNLYAVNANSTGLPLHWDHQDVLILQIEGTKHWDVYKPTIKYPTDRSPSSSSDYPREKVLECVLGPGDLLYIPRGWWHYASTKSVGSLHLTINAIPPTGMDFLRWFVGTLAQNEPLVRSPIPVSKFNLRERYVLDVKDLIEKSLNMESIGMFYRQRDQQAIPRPLSSLESIMMDGTFDWDDTDTITLRAARPIKLEVNGNEFTFVAGGTRWRISERIASAIENLLSRRATTIGELLSKVSAGATAELRLVVVGLHMAGLLSRRKPSQKS